MPIELLKLPEKKNWYFYPRAWTTEKSSRHTLLCVRKTTLFFIDIKFPPWSRRPRLLYFIDRSFGIELDDGSWNVWSFLVCSSKISHSSSCSPRCCCVSSFSSLFAKGILRMCVVLNSEWNISRTWTENRSNRELNACVCANENDGWEMRNGKWRKWTRK